MYYLIENEFPTVKLRQYRNTRVAKYTVDQLNTAAGFEKYSFISDSTPVIIRRVPCTFDVDVYADLRT